MNRRRVTGHRCGCRLWRDSALSASSLGRTAPRAVPRPAGSDCRRHRGQARAQGRRRCHHLAATHVGTVQQKALQPGALTSEDQIGTQVAAADLQPGDSWSRPGSAGQRSMSCRQVTISASRSAERAVGGTIEGRRHRGCVPQLRAVRHEQAGVGHHHPGQDAEHHAPGVPASAGDQRPDGGDPVRPTRTGSSSSVVVNYIVTLALTPAQSERFVFATSSARVALNEPATVKDDGTGSSRWARLHGGEVMNDTIIYAPPGSRTRWPSVSPGCPSRSRPAPTGTCPRPRP